MKQHDYTVIRQPFRIVAGLSACPVPMGSCPDVQMVELALGSTMTGIHLTVKEDKADSNVDQVQTKAYLAFVQDSTELRMKHLSDVMQTCARQMLLMDDSTSAVSLGF